MEIFITKSVGEVTESISVSGIKGVKDVLDLYKGMSSIVGCDTNNLQYPKVTLDDGRIAVGGITLGENSCNSKLLAREDINLTELEISTESGIKEFKDEYKSDLGDGTYLLRAIPTSGREFDLTIGDIKLLHKEFGEIIKFWEE